MSKGEGYAFSGTKGDIVHLIQNLPSKPNKEFLENWDDVTNPKARENSSSRQYRHKETGLKVRFDPAKEGAPGFNGKDHWHVNNPNKTNKKDEYLDENGNPTPRGSATSHIVQKK